ncbi:MAG: hypothetical protein KDA62_02370, partial [Planctomycetales bacterium]|nr:hypothetical protein [Planctomycetales bacterium]
GEVVGVAANSAGADTDAGNSAVTSAGAGPLEANDPSAAELSSNNSAAPGSISILDTSPTSPDAVLDESALDDWATGGVVRGACWPQPSMTATAILVIPKPRMTNGDPRRDVRMTKLSDKGVRRASQRQSRR